MIPIQFWDPNSRMTGERRSKLIKPDSQLYSWLESKRTELKLKYPDQIGNKRMDFHIELIQSNEIPSEDMLVQRAQSLEGQNINPSMYAIGKIIALDTPYVTGYGQTHITIAHFPKGVPVGIF